MSTRIVLCGWVLALLVPGPLPAQTIYRWHDVAGRTHYGDTPPPHQASERLDADLAGRNVVTAPPPVEADARAVRVRRVGAAAAAGDCAAIEAELAELRERLRAGYGVAEGEQLSARQRELRYQRLTEC